MSLEFQEQSEDRQFEPGREHLIFPLMKYGGSCRARCGIMPSACNGCKTTKIKPRTCSKIHRRHESVPPPDLAPATVVVGVEPVDEEIPDDPDGRPVDIVAEGSGAFYAQGKLFSSNPYTHVFIDWTSHTLSTCGRSKHCLV
jgi:hypothetical protein